MPFKPYKNAITGDEQNSPETKYHFDRREFIKLGGLTAAGLMLPSALQHTFGQGTAKTRKQWGHYFLGSAYYPEWWAPSEWERDFRKMSELGFNTVRMGEFAWATFEPAGGKFEFGWMDKAIAIANHYHIDVILGTPTASVPPWLHQLHPDVLGANEFGPYTYGGRKGYCTNSRNYLDACARITTALATHYGRHPGVIGWQIDNEPGTPFKCYDQNCEHAFRLWLKKRYGTLDALNRAWGGAFWSNNYSDWQQIGFPKNSAESGWQPAISLDYRRFFSDSYLNHLKLQAAILRKHTANQFIFTNWPNLTWSVDTVAGGEFMDATAWDNYHEAPGINAFQNQYDAGFQHDLARAAGPHQRFFCAEQMAYIPPNAPNKGLRLQAYINLAHGSYGHLYFEWRRPDAGNEENRPSMVMLNDGSINPAEQVFKLIGQEFARIGPRLAGTTTSADIAMLYDYPNEWAQGFWSGQNGYDQEAGRYYRGFKALQRNIDIVPLKTNLSGYRLVLAPNLVMIDDATVEKLRAYVLNGGILVLNSRAATRNMANGMRRVLSPGPFADMAGVTVASSVAGYTAKENLKLEPAIDIAFSGNKTTFKPRTILEAITLKGAEPVATFSGGRMDGLPAITRHSFGQGQVFYVGTDSGEDTFHEALARLVANAGNIAPLIAAPYGVEVTSRENAETTFYFMLNLTEKQYDNIDLPSPMDDLVTGKTGLTKVTLGPLEAAVLSSVKRQQ